ncbi:MAG: hypothetical protein K2K58_00710, partial [Muribaculaceae bacterium]|nr:hypothetical protein [Muribaculaceae bacterium]
TYMYVLPESDSLKDRLLNYGQPLAKANYQSGFVSIQFSGCLAVIKTRNGYASGLAYDIDMSNSPEILGTISGTDTILAVLRENVTRQRAAELFANILGINVEDINI